MFRNSTIRRKFFTAATSLTLALVLAFSPFVSLIGTDVFAANEVFTNTADKTVNGGESVAITDLQINGDGNENLNMTLYVSNGSFSFGTMAGLTFTSANTGNNLKFSGTRSALNTALATLEYTAVPYTNGTYEIEALIDEADGSVYRHANGHVYKVVTVGGDGISWTDAKVAAEAYTFPGAVSTLNGYLATIVDEDEHNFVRARIDEDGWIGASDDTGITENYSGSGEGEWFWVTGPEAGTKFWTGGVDGLIVNGQYANWNKISPANEPNNSSGNENCAQIRFTVAGAEGKWNDLPCTTKLPKYVVEFGDNDPNNLPAVKRETFNVTVTSPEFTPVTQCFTADEPGIYVLTQNIAGVTGDCIIITASNVVIDGNGFSIVGTGGNTGAAIKSEAWYMDDRENTEIKNVNIVSFDKGVYVKENDTVRIDNVRVTSSGSGIWVEGQWGEGIEVYNEVSITNSILTSNGSGIVIHAMRDVELSENIINASSGQGIVVATSSENVLVYDNKLNSIQGKGIVLKDSVGLELSGNSVTAIGAVVEMEAASAVVKGNTLIAMANQPVISVLSSNDQPVAVEVVANIIRGIKWVSVDSDMTSGIVFSKSGIGNSYRFGNNDGAWLVFDIVDTDANGYADTGEDVPFADGLEHIEVVLWTGPAVDYHPATTLTPSAVVEDKVMTNAATNVAEKTVTLNGAVSGSVYQVHGRWFEYGTTTSYGQEIEDAPSEGYPTGAFSLNVTGLTCATTYHFRMGASINNDNTTYDAFGNDMTFTTAACSNNGGGNSGSGSTSSTKRVVGGGGGGRSAVVTTTTTNTPTSTTENNSGEAKKQCSADQLLTQDMKAGARNGRFNAYAKTTVTEVKILQAHMNRLGFNSGAVDGILGPITDGAIKRMQVFLGTTADGYVGPITRSLINASCGADGLQKSV